MLVSDVHIGKGDTFRRFGLPMPDADLAADLQRLTHIVHSHRATRLLVLGDWVHAAAGLNDTVVAMVAAWRNALDAEVELVPGNHDKHAPPEVWRMRVRPDGHTEGAFRFAHVPGAHAGAYTWAGHLHPAVLSGRRRLTDRFPCFWLGERVGVLPAFGAFTGGAVVRPDPGDRRFVITADGLVAV